ncbi:hypothetical protein AB3662_44595 [Sorangium cellulosum]|uniref:hypothetical protein n=1 Tax=Sorangium cellulosum TaxID=56 RepID=UPI003D9A8D5E
MRVVLAPQRGLRGATDEGRFDKEVPSGKPFTVEVSIKDLPRVVDGDAIGTLDVWPKLETNPNDDRCSLPSTNDGVRQHHKLALVLSTQGDKAVLSAEVPALQIGQEFCFLFDVRARPSEATNKRVATLAATRLEASLLHDCTFNASDTAFRSALNNGASAIGLSPTVTPGSAEGARVRYLLDGVEQCSKAANLEDKRGRALADIANRQAVYQRLVNDLATLVVPDGLKVPMFGEATGLTSPLDSLFKKNVDPSKLTSAIEQIRARLQEPLYRPQQSIFGRWKQLLEDFQSDLTRDPEKAAAKAQTEAKKIPVPLSPEVFLDGKFMHLSEFQSKIAGGAGVSPFDPVKLVEQIREMQLIYLPKPPTAVAQLDLWVAKLREIANAEKGLHDKEKERDEALTGLKAAKKELNAKLIEAMNIADVRHDIEQNVGTLATSFKLGRAKTADVGNIASLDFGVAAAVPSGGDEVKLWLVPYLGVNIYFTPVDRTISIDQIVGPRFRQRFSLTFGYTLTSPTLPGRTLKNFFLDRYPVVGGGYRMSNYMRATAGAILYQLADKNPASTNTHLRAAPFGGFSLDGDIIDIITKAAK